MKKNKIIRLILIAQLIFIQKNFSVSMTKQFFMTVFTASSILFSAFNLKQYNIDKSQEKKAEYQLNEQNQQNTDYTIKRILFFYLCSELINLAIGLKGRKKI